APADPARPDLYAVAAAASTADRLWYAANEGIQVGGGASQSDGSFIWDITDTKQGKSVAVWLNSNNAVNDILIVDAAVDQHWQFTQGGGTQTEQAQLVVAGQVTKTWVADSSTHKFVAQ